MHGCAVLAILQSHLLPFPRKNLVPLVAGVDMCQGESLLCPLYCRKQGLQVFPPCPVMPIVMGMYSKEWGFLGGPP